MAKLIECGTCHGRISSKAPACCHCGHRKFSFTRAGCKLIVAGFVWVPIGIVALVFICFVIAMQQ